MKQIRRFLILLLASILFSTFLVKSYAEERLNNIKIGIILPLTGPSASLGEWFKNGYVLAVEEINQSGGIQGQKIQLLIEDGAGDPKTSISAFNKLIAIEKIKIAATTLSGPSLALVPISESNGILMFANAAHPQITIDRKYVLRHSNTVDQESEIIAQYLTDILKPNKIAIAYANDDFGLAFNDKLTNIIKEKTNISINSSSFDKNESNFRSHAIKLISNKPDGIVVLGFVKNMGLIIKRLRESGYQGFIFVNFAFTMPDLKALAGKAAEGCYYIDYEVNQNNSQYKALTARYKEKFHGDLPPVSLLGYNTVTLLKYGIENAGIDNANLITFLKNLKVFEKGAGWKLVITPQGDILPQMKVVRYHESSK